jgi:hypothetical protein
MPFMIQSRESLRACSSPDMAAASAFSNVAAASGIRPTRRWASAIVLSVRGSSRPASQTAAENACAAASPHRAGRGVGAPCDTPAIRSRSHPRRGQGACSKTGSGEAGGEEISARANLHKMPSSVDAT